jgi:hypothetical protein
MSFLIPESSGSGDNIFDIALPSVVAVQIKEGEKIFDLVELKDLIFCDDVFGEYDFPIFFCEFLFITNHLDTFNQIYFNNRQISLSLLP